MPRPSKPKLTGQQEKFCREYVRLGSASAAYRCSYNVRATTKPESIWTKASLLLSKAEVRSRIDQLQEQAAKRAGVTRESMLIEMHQNREFAIYHDNPAAAESASRDRAKVAGLMNDDLTKMGDIHIHFAAELKSVL